MTMQTPPASATAAAAASFDGHLETVAFVDGGMSGHPGPFGAEQTFHIISRRYPATEAKVWRGE